MQATRASGLPSCVIVSHLALAWLPDLERSVFDPYRRLRVFELALGIALLEDRRIVAID